MAWWPFSSWPGTDGRLPSLVEDNGGRPVCWRHLSRLPPSTVWVRSSTSTAIYGLGTVINLYGPSSWPGSSAVRDIRRDAAGWRALGADLATYSEPLFALDYSIASQIWYYSGRPAYTAWPQYQLWGIPPLQDVTIVGLDYLPEGAISTRLAQVFRKTEGPRELRYEERGAVKKVRVWQAEGLSLDDESFLQQFDFLSLLEAAR